MPGNFVNMCCGFPLDVASGWFLIGFDPWMDFDDPRNLFHIVFPDCIFVVTVANRPSFEYGSQIFQQFLQESNFSSEVVSFDACNPLPIVFPT